MNRGSHSPPRSSCRRTGFAGIGDEDGLPEAPLYFLLWISSRRFFKYSAYSFCSAGSFGEP
jgi:hypothetical protein